MTAKRILTVDDEKSITSVLEKILCREGFVTEKAHDGQRALEILAEDTGFDAVISGFSMPRMNGGLLSEAINKQYPGLPFMLLSAYPPDYKVLARLPICDFLPKPMEIDLLISSLQSICRWGNNWRGDSRRHELWHSYLRMENKSSQYPRGSQSLVSEFVHETLPQYEICKSICFLELETVAGLAEHLWQQLTAKSRNAGLSPAQNITFTRADQNDLPMIVMHIQNRHPLDPLMAALTYSPEKQEYCGGNYTRLFTMQNEVIQGRSRKVITERVTDAPGAIIRKHCRNMSPQTFIADVIKICIKSERPLLHTAEPAAMRTTRAKASADLLKKTKDLGLALSGVLINRLLQEKHALDDMIIRVNGMHSRLTMESYDYIERYGEASYTKVNKLILSYLKVLEQTAQELPEVIDNLLNTHNGKILMETLKWMVKADGKRMRLKAKVDALAIKY